jgi:hypothetical protein
MRVFRKRNASTVSAWIVEVDYGDGWIPYGPPLEKRSAEVFAHDLKQLGRLARIAPVEPVLAEVVSPRARDAADLPATAVAT